MKSSEKRPVFDEVQLAELRRDMLRFASLQLRDEPLAEDLVQEAMAAVLLGEKSFTGRSALKTWVFAILKNKIVDAIRQRSRTSMCRPFKGRAKHGREIRGSVQGQRALGARFTAERLGKSRTGT